MGSKRVACESSKLSLKRKSHSDVFLSLQNQRDNEKFCDVQLVCSGGTFAAHRMVLASCSNFFKAMFQETPGEMMVVLLKEVQASSISALLDFMYMGEVNIPENELAILTSTAKLLQIKGLLHIKDNAVADLLPSLSNDGRNSRNSSCDESKECPALSASSNSTSPEPEVWQASASTKPLNGCLPVGSNRSVPPDQHSQMALHISNNFYNLSVLPQLLRRNPSSSTSSVCEGRSKLLYPNSSINSLITSLAGCTGNTASLSNGLVPSVSAATPVPRRRSRSSSPQRRQMMKEETDESPDIIMEEGAWSPQDHGQHPSGPMSDGGSPDHALRNRSSSRPSSPCVGSSIFRPPQAHLGAMSGLEGVGHGAMSGLETLLRPSRFPPSGSVQSMVNPLSSFLRPGSPHDAFPPHNLAQLVSSGSSSTHWSRPSAHHALPLLSGALSGHSVHGHTSDKGSISGKNTGVVCSNCSTNNTRLWRRNPKGDIVCNACGLYFKLHNVDRPSHLFRDSPMTRRRNPRAAQRKRPYDQGLPNVTCSSGSEDVLRLSPVTGHGMAGGSSNCVLSPRTVTSPGPQSEDVLSAAYALSSIKSHRTALPQRDAPHQFEAASSREAAVKLEDQRGTASLPERKPFTYPSNYSDALTEPGDTVERLQSVEESRDFAPRCEEDDGATDGIDDLYDDAHATPLHLPDSREAESCPSPRPPPPPLLRLPEQRPPHRPSTPDTEDPAVLVSPSLGPSLKA